MDPLLLMMALGGQAASALGDIGGSILTGSLSAKRNYKYSLRLQRQQQKWMEEMSKTAHQREVADLRAAGLNPILSSHSSGSQVSAASAPAVHGESVDDAFSKGAKTGEYLTKLSSAVSNTNADTNLKEAEVETEKTAQTLNLANAEKASADAALSTSKLMKETASPYSSDFGKDISAMTKNTFNFSKEFLGKPLERYIFDRQKSSATKKDYHNNSGKHSAYSNYSVNGAEVNKRSPDYSKFEDKSGKPPLVMKYRIDKDGKFHWVK